MKCITKDLPIHVFWLCGEISIFSCCLQKPQMLCVEDYLSRTAHNILTWDVERFRNVTFSKAKLLRLVATTNKSICGFSEVARTMLLRLVLTTHKPIGGSSEVVRTMYLMGSVAFFWGIRACDRCAFSQDHYVRSRLCHTVQMAAKNTPQEHVVGIPVELLMSWSWHRPSGIGQLLA